MEGEGGMEGERWREGKKGADVWWYFDTHFSPRYFQGGTAKVFFFSHRRALWFGRFHWSLQLDEVFLGDQMAPTLDSFLLLFLFSSPIILILCALNVFPSELPLSLSHTSQPWQCHSDDQLACWATMLMRYYNIITRYCPVGDLVVLELSLSLIQKSLPVDDDFIQEKKNVSWC